jgi:hypothetical protein
VSDRPVLLLARASARNARTQPNGTDDGTSTERRVIAQREHPAHGSGSGGTLGARFAACERERERRLCGLTRVGARTRARLPRSQAGARAFLLHFIPGMPVFTDRAFTRLVQMVAYAGSGPVIWVSDSRVSPQGKMSRC